MFAYTSDDDPVSGPANPDPLGTTSKWFDRCAASVADGCEIRQKWEALGKSRIMLDHKGDKPKVEEMRPAVLSVDTTGKASDPKVVKANPWNRPAHPRTKREAAQPLIPRGLECRQ